MDWQKIRRGVLRRLSQALPHADIPASVKLGAGFTLQHGGIGVVVNGHTTIGDRVHVFPNVVIGRYDAELRSINESRFEHIVIEDDVIIYANAVVLGGPGVTTIGRGAVIGAGAVVTGSVGPGEVWTGNPATFQKMRRGYESVPARAKLDVPAGTAVVPAPARVIERS